MLGGDTLEGSHKEAKCLLDATENRKCQLHSCIRCPILDSFVQYDFTGISAKCRRGKIAWPGLAYLEWGLTVIALCGCAALTLGPQESMCSEKVIII
jgi:hypothetical protein